MNNCDPNGLPTQLNVKVSSPRTLVTFPASDLIGACDQIFPLSQYGRPSATTMLTSLGTLFEAPVNIPPLVGPYGTSQATLRSDHGRLQRISFLGGQRNASRVFITVRSPLAVAYMCISLGASSDFVVSAQARSV